MKRIRVVVVVATILVAVSLTHAQRISGGLKLGVDFANFHGDAVEDSKFKVGFCGGGFLAWPLGEIVAIQPELLYVQKGAKWEEYYEGDIYRLTYKFNYLEIPLLIKVSIPIKGTVKPNLFLGPYFAIMIGDPRGKLEINGMTMEDDLVGVEDTDFGIAFGGGTDFGIGKHKVTFDVRYTLGLTTLDEEGVDVKNNVMSLMVGYAF